MAVNSKRTVTITFEEDVEYNQTFEAVENSTSPGVNETQALASGANTITAPTGAAGCTIIPPAGNTTTMTLKGVSGDTGIALALTSPTSLGLSGVSTFVITTNGPVTVRLIWT